jgi:hypothetical protein
LVLAQGTCLCQALLVRSARGCVSVCHVRSGQALTG